MTKLRLSRNTRFNRRYATREFTNRDRLLERVGLEVGRLRCDADYFFVLSFYGIGGIGKSSLLKRLRQRHASAAVSWISLDLESVAYMTPADALYEIYRASHVRYFPFEYALARVWGRRGLAIHDIRNRLVALDSFWSDVGDAALEALSAAVSLRALAKSWNTFSDAVRKRKHEAEVADIEGASDSERERMLSALLGEAIRARARAGGLVVTVDALDSLAGRPGFRGGGWDSSDAWLEELIAAAERGVWLLAAREKLRWYEEAPDWNKVLEQHLVGALTDADAVAFLRGVDITEPTIVKAIVQATSGVPMALDVAASLYLAKRDDGVLPVPGDFRDTPDGMLTKFLSHLDRHHADAIRCLALFDEFDYDIAVAALGAWNLPITLPEFEVICKSIMAEHVGSAVYRIHSIVRGPVGRAVPQDDKWRVLSAVLKRTAGIEGHAHRRLWLFSRCLVFMREQRVGVGKRRRLSSCRATV